MVRTICGATKSGVKHKIDIISKTLSLDWLMNNTIIDPVYCLNKCKSYIQPKTSKITSCPSRGKYHSCSGDKIDFRDHHPLWYKMDPILFGFKLSFHKLYDSSFMSQFFGDEKWPWPGQSRMAKIKYAYGKLDLANNAMWNIIKELVTVDGAVVYAFGHCKMCKKCSMSYRKKCKMASPIYSMERVGIIVDVLVKKALGIDIQWILPKENGEDMPIRPDYICSFALAFTDKEDAREHISDRLYDILSAKLVSN